MSDQNRGNTGAIIGSLIIVILLLAGGFFAWKNSGSIQVQTPDNTYQQPTDAIAQPTTPPQESTEITDIAADANALDLKPLDTGLDNLDLLVK